MNMASGGLAVIWIDWYSYHVARFRALTENPTLAGRSFGIELVGGTGVHRGTAFREAERGNLPIRTLLPDCSWHEAGQLRLARALWAELNSLKPAAVLIPGYYTLPGVAAALWCRLNGKLPVLMTESAEQDHRRSFAKEVLKRISLRLLFDRAVSGGTVHVQYLRKLGMSADRIGRFYDTVDNEFFRSRARQLRETTTARAQGLPDHYFLFAGRLAPEKNVATLIRAFCLYRANGGTFHLVLAGEGPLAAVLREQAEASGFSSSIHFPGFQTTAELAVLYAFASCFVLPSEREPWGLVVNEAMAASLPVLVSDRAGCAPDLVEEGGNGWQFPPHDAPRLSTLLHRIEDLGAASRPHFGHRSEEIVARYCPENWAAEVARLTSARLHPLASPQATETVEAL